MTGWNWAAFQGSAAALGYARRDLPNLEAVIALVPQRRQCVQAGGSLGIWPKRLAAAFEAVLTCEPDEGNVAKLRANAPERNIAVHAVALGERSGTVRLNRQRRDGKPTAHEGCPHVDRVGETVPVMAIDDFDVAVCDLLYLDVEGYELHALRGSEGLLQQLRPVVATEVNQKHLQAYGVTEADLLGFMTGHGYLIGPRFGLDQVFLPLEAA